MLGVALSAFVVGFGATMTSEGVEGVEGVDVVDGVEGFDGAAGVSGVVTGTASGL